ncbi:MAG: succinate dehydrogenase, cytochrome b556 subunit [Neisseriaceae bacterium]|jgi:succinate dehydrogenase / fumarate reductase cytochrome b subunit
MQTKSRPKYLGLFTLANRMSITAKVSILHRITGFLLFLSIPFILYILHKSLISPNFYTAFYGVTTSIVMKLIYLILIFALVYHACAGIRFLFLDIHFGTQINTAKKTAGIVILVSIILTIVLGVLIW